VLLVLTMINNLLRSARGGVLKPLHVGVFVKKSNGGKQWETLWEKNITYIVILVAGGETLLCRGYRSCLSMTSLSFVVAIDELCLILSSRWQHQGFERSAVEHRMCNRT